MLIFVERMSMDAYLCAALNIMSIEMGAFLGKEETPIEVTTGRASSGNIWLYFERSPKENRPRLLNLGEEQINILMLTQDFSRSSSPSTKSSAIANDFKNNKFVISIHFFRTRLFSVSKYSFKESSAIWRCGTLSDAISKELLICGPPSSSGLISTP